MDKQGGHYDAAENGILLHKAWQPPASRAYKYSDRHAMGYSNCGVKVVPLDGRLRFETKFKVETPTKECSDSRSMTGRENTRLSGAGVYQQDTNKGAYFSLGVTILTIFQAELYAILEFATSKEVTEELEGVIEIYSDRQAVLKVVCSAKMGNRLN